jgi:hypothetical protein
MQNFNCICGSAVQLRNINNHFITKKHINFLLKCGNLIYKYEALSRKEAYISKKTLKIPKKKEIHPIEFDRNMEGNVIVSFN